MSVPKLLKEFHQVDLGTGWEVPAGYPPGLQQKILSGSLDEARKKGSRTRLMRYLPGGGSTTGFLHEYWEEVYCVEGDFELFDEKTGKVLETFGPGAYACRPPGAYHGPFRSKRGCLLFEIHYFDEN
jgi:ChrR Cupin-like domain